MSNSAYVEFSELKEVGAGESTIVMLGAAVIAEGVSIQETITKTSIVSTAAEAVGVVKVSNLSDDDDILFVVATSQPANFNSARFLKAGQDITLNCPANSKVYLKKVI